MKSLITRATSAVIAVTLILVLYYFFQKDGFKILITLGVIVGNFELVKILLKDMPSRSSKYVFYIFSISIFGICSRFPSFAAITFSFIAIVYLLFSILILHKFESLEELSRLHAKSILGFFYMGLLPSFMVRLLDLPNGMTWFTGLLAIVFAGDIGAYLIGLNFGKHKIMPLVSPKKTIEGSIGGILFSLIAAIILSYWFDHVNPLALGLLSIPTSIAAQFGDFFESVLKRVADVKDSGRIMPGHGGILDRIDGVLFAAPIILFGSIVLEGLLY